MTASKWNKRIKRLAGLILSAGLVLSSAIPSEVFRVPVLASARTGHMTRDEVPSYEGFNGSCDDETLAALYDHAMEITDEEALLVSLEKPTGLSAIEELPEGAALVRAVKAYEVKKALYLLGRGRFPMPDQETENAWNRQKELNEFYFGNGASEVLVLIPSVSLESVTVCKQGYRLALTEWMTLGYSDRSISDVICFSAYSMEYSMLISYDGSFVSGVINEEELFSEMDEAAAAERIPDNGLVRSNLYADESGQGLLRSGGIPSYNPDGALSYADQWALSRNPAFSDYTGKGGDCANFVSQCLFAGGLPTDGTWYKDSKAWIAVIALSNWLCDKYGLPRLVADNSNIQVGSPVCYAWHSNWQSTYGLKHVTLCVGRNAQGMPIVSGHTRDIKGVAWNYGYRDTTYMTIPLGGNSLPMGYFDAADGGAGNVYVKGWAYDPDHPDQPVTIQLYMDGLPGQGGILLKQFKAKKNRQDLVNAGYPCGPKHGFEKTISLSVKGNHTFYALALDLDDGNQNVALTNSPLNTKVKSPYTVKIPKIKCKEWESTVIKVQYSGPDIDSVEWEIKNEATASCVQDSAGTSGKKDWVRLKVTGKAKGTTKLIFRLLDEDGEVLYQKKQDVKIKYNPNPVKPEPEEPSTEEPSTEEPSTEEPSTEQPSTEQPSTEEPSTEQPSTEQPSTEQPLAD